jgi:hypothetical protein
MDGGLSSRVEVGSKPITGAHGSERRAQHGLQNHVARFDSLRARTRNAREVSGSMLAFQARGLGSFSSTRTHDEQL